MAKKQRKQKNSASSADNNLNETATPLEILLSKGKQSKVLTQSEVIKVLPDGGLDDEAAERLIAQLVENGIEVVDDEGDATESLADVDEPDDDELKEVEEELEEESNTATILPVSSADLTNDPVRMYLREIGQVNLLTAADEVRLAKRIQRGVEAQQKLKQNGDHSEDEILKFKKLEIDAWWIRQAISRAIADQARVIRIPVHMVETINKLMRIQRRLLQEYGRDPTAKEVALEMNILSDENVETIKTALEQKTALDPALERRWRRAASKVRRIIRISQEPMSLETPIGTEENSYLGDFIEDETIVGPVDAASKQLLKEQLNEILGSLNDRERKVLEMRFGLSDGQGRTLEEVGAKFGVTRERIRQIEAKALRKLRHPIRSRKLRDYLS